MFLTFDPFGGMSDPLKTIVNYRIFGGGVNCELCRSRFCWGKRLVWTKEPLLILGAYQHHLANTVE